jgi:phosphoenolpyruvate-protein kinase (PTS system EI component)
MGVKFELPVTALEPLFTVLHSISPSKATRLEMKAVGLLRNALLFELEKAMETPDEKEERRSAFKKLFEEEREKQRAKFKENVKG